LKDTTKVTQIGIFWFEKIPSGNPDVRVRFEKQSQKRTKDFFAITYA
jgi:hypothetical protein